MQPIYPTEQVRQLNLLFTFWFTVTHTCLSLIIVHTLNMRCSIINSDWNVIFCRWADNHVNPTNCDVWRRRSSLLPDFGAMGKQIRWYNAKNLWSWWKTSNHICRYVVDYFIHTNFVLTFLIRFEGNVAHAHILAKKALKTNPKSIAGLPVFITDDTPIEDTTRFCQRLSRRTNTFSFRQSAWYIPSLLAYFLAFLFEFFIRMVNKVFDYQLSFQPRALVAYAGSLLLYSRLRAELHMDYVPKYDEETSLSSSAKWYAQWYESNFKTSKSKNSWSVIVFIMFL